MFDLMFDTGWLIAAVASFVAGMGAGFLTVAWNIFKGDESKSEQSKIYD